MLVVAVGSQPLLADDHSGNVLVDKLVQVLDNAARSTVLNPSDINKSLDDLKAQVTTAKSEHQVDDLFYNRYTRVLRMCKLATAHDEGDTLAQQEYAAFVKDVTGKKIDAEVAMPVLVQAINQELESLKKSLDQKK
jgi:hypothetical protein